MKHCLWASTLVFSSFVFLGLILTVSWLHDYITNQNVMKMDFSSSAWACWSSRINPFCTTKVPSRRVSGWKWRDWKANRQLNNLIQKAPAQGQMSWNQAPRMHHKHLGTFETSLRSNEHASAFWKPIHKVPLIICVHFWRPPWATLRYWVGNLYHCFE